MNISYEKSKLLKDIETKYPRTNKNRFTRNLLNLLYLLNPHTPLQNLVNLLYLLNPHTPLQIFTTYKRITKGNLFYIKCYTAPAEILYDEIKPVIQVVKIGLTRDMIIPEDITQQYKIQLQQKRFED